jgi:hypothetical protein
MIMKKNVFIALLCSSILTLRISAADYPAGPIFSDAYAQHVCEAVCVNHGGWTGNWKTVVPGQISVCGCRY